MSQKVTFIKKISRFFFKNDMDIYFICITKHTNLKSKIRKKYKIPMKKYTLSKRNKAYRVRVNTEPIFYAWLNENIQRFPFKPILITHGLFYFEGITKAIKLHIDFSQPEAELHFCNPEEGENYDLYSIEYIGYLKHHPLYGFYDADKTNKKDFKYYKTYSSLIINEVFEKIIEFLNHNFIKGNVVYLLKETNYTEAFISNSDESNLAIKKLKQLQNLRKSNNSESKILKFTLM